MPCWVSIIIDGTVPDGLVLTADEEAGLVRMVPVDEFGRLGIEGDQFEIVERRGVVRIAFAPFNGTVH